MLLCVLTRRRNKKQSATDKSLLIDCNCVVKFYSVCRMLLCVFYEEAKQSATAKSLQRGSASFAVKVGDWP